MIRQIGRITALATLALGVSLTAAERATFILTDGERVSGEVVFHTEARTNIRADKNEFNVKVANGTEMPIPFDHVVFIDFVGGQPRSEELSALPADGHLLTLRNGETKTGRLVDMIAGTTVRWSSDGRESDLPITQVRRIYLKPDRVRELFNVPATGQQAEAATPSTPSTPSRGGRGGTQAVATTTVRGATDWVDTGVNVRRGLTLKFESTGTVYYARDNSASSTPAGKGAPGSQFPVSSLPVGALIGKIGANGTPFAIGANTDAITMNGNGRLFLGVNDTEFDDNSGSYSVRITR